VGQKSYIIFLILILQIFSSSSPKESARYISQMTIKGTLIIGAIGTDGIILAVDSRVCIIGPDSNVIGYIDSIPKLSLLNDQFPIAFAGKSTIGEEFVESIIKQFNDQENRSRNVQESFIDFREVLEKVDNRFSQKFIGGGYYEAKPYLFSFNNTERSADPTGFVFSEPDLAPYIEKYTDRTRSCKQLGNILEAAIYSYAQDKKKEFEIGGPISIINVLPGNEIVWQQNNFSSRRVKNYTTFVNLIKEDKINLTPVPGVTREYVIRAMESNPKYKK